MELFGMDLKMLITKSIGYSIVVASAFVKLPQLLKLFASQSSAGLSFIGSFMELLAVTFTTSYAIVKKFPFSAWGEAPFLQLETALITFLILWYDLKQTKAVMFLVMYVAAVVVLVSGIMSPEVLWYLQAMNLPLAVTGKMVQARKNYINQHTGQMSAITIFLLCGGCVARVFTSIQETGDSVVILTFVAASVANFILVMQVVYYWTQTEKFLKAEEKKKLSKSNTVRTTLLSQVFWCMNTLFLLLLIYILYWES